MAKQYDIIIIGGGAAGLTAALYGGRARMKTLVIEGKGIGGQIVQTAEIENYPGSQSIESGPSLMERFQERAVMFGAEIVYDNIISVDLTAFPKRLKGETDEYEAKAVIIAVGASPAKIGCPGEEELTGMGVSYCATCDGPFFEGLPIYVVGGGDAAVEEAMYLTKFARKVTIIHRRDELRAAKSIQEKAFKIDNLDFMWDTVVEKLGGDDILQEMEVRNVKTGEITKIEADEEDGMFGLFGFIGRVPNSEIFKDTGLEMDPTGYIPTNQDMMTNIEGVFACGDIRVKTLRQVVTAAGDGAIAATMCDRYINGVIPAFEEKKA